MNALTTFFRPTYDEILAGLRMQFSIVEQPRDDAGRFVSKRDIVRKQLAEASSRLTDAQRKELVARAVTIPLTDKQRGRGA